MVKQSCDRRSFTIFIYLFAPNKIDSKVICKDRKTQGVKSWVSIRLRMVAKMQDGTMPKENNKGLNSNFLPNLP